MNRTSDRRFSHTLLHYGLPFLTVMILLLNTAAFYRNGTAFADSDTAAELMLARVLNQEHRLLCSPNWIYSTELRVLNTQIFYRIGFLFTENWHLARTISLLLMWIVLLGCLKYFLKASGILKSPVLSVIAFILPFSSEYTQFVLYGGYYIPHIALMMVMLGEYYGCVKPQCRKWILPLGILTAFGAGLGGVRQVLIGYFPLFITNAVLFYLENRNADTAGRMRASKSFRGLKVSLSFFLACLAGWAVNLKVLSRFFTYINTYTGMPLLKMDPVMILQFLANSFVEIFGYSGTANAISVKGIGALAALVFIALFLFFLARCITRRSAMNENQLHFTLFVSAGILFNAVFCILSDFHSTRYMIPSLLPSVVLLDLGISLSHTEQSLFKKAILGFCSVSLLYQSFCTVYLDAALKNNANQDLIRTADWLLENGYTNGYSPMADVFWELTDARVDCWNIPGDRWWTLEHQNWLETKEHAARRPEGTVFLTVRKDQLALIDPSSPLVAKAMDTYKTEQYTTFIYPDTRTLEQLAEQTIPAEQ